MPIIFCVDSGRSDSCPHASQVSISPMETSSSPIVLRDWKHNLQLFSHLHFIFWCYCWVFWHTEVLSLMKSRFFSFFACTFGLISKNVLSNLNSQRFFLCVLVSILRFGHLIHFELTFICRVQQVSRFIPSEVAKTTPFVDRLSGHWMGMAPLLATIWAPRRGSVSETYSLF